MVHDLDMSITDDNKLDNVLKLLSARFVHCKVAIIIFIIKSNLGEMHYDSADVLYLNFAP